MLNFNSVIDKIYEKLFVYILNIRKGIIMNRKKCPSEKSHQKKNANVYERYEEGFYFIAGYTSAGHPYGLTFEEADEQGLYELETEQLNKEIDDEEMPF